VNYVQNTDADRRAMLAEIGADSIDELMAVIPEDCRFVGELDIEPALTEDALLREMKALADKNISADTHSSFLGMGSYRHFCPALVDNLVGRTEYWTAYTPYQPEASQGTLTTILEWQTMMCRLTGMEVSNASVYDGATAVVESVLMALRLRPKATSIVVSDGLHPDTRGALKTYMGNLGVRIVEAKLEHGATPSGNINEPDVAAVVFQSPNVFGVIEDVESLCQTAHAFEALAIVSADPISLSLLTPPGEVGADIVCGDANPMGNKPWFGGPGVGYMCCRMEHVRQMPARIAGETVDSEGRRAVVLTFQTREQHIRRAKATSNICTSQQLMALRATIWMSLLGKEGFAELGRTNLSRSHYAAERIAALPGFELTYPQHSFFKEFTLSTPLPAAKINKLLLKKHGIIGGYDLGRMDKSLANRWLLAVTDVNTRNEIDALVAALETIA
jgi:glycine dehydrogenase subunit 1